MRRRTSRRLFLAGGVGVAAAAGGGWAWSQREPEPEPLPAVGTFSLALNISGLEDPVPEGPTPAMMDAYAKHGITHVRLPGRWAHFQPEPLGPLDEEYLALYLGVIAQLNRRGISVTAEPCHDYGGREIAGVDHKIGDGTLTTAMFTDFWKRFVRATGDIEGITRYELMGEPVQLPRPTRAAQSELWAKIAQAGVDTLRDLGDVRPIVIDVYQPGSHLAWTEDNVALHTVTDPLDKLIFSTHVYMDRNNSGKFPHWSTEVAVGNTFAGGPLTHNAGVERLEPFVAWLRQHNLRGEVGEIGVGWADAEGSNSAAGWLMALDTTLSYCRSVGLPVVAWGAGLHLVRPYELSLEPDAGMMAPQWQVLGRYLPPSTR